MVFTRILRSTLTLLLFCTGSGLPLLCTQCAESPAPMACHTDMPVSIAQVDAMQAGCCCILAASSSEQQLYVSFVESVAAATAQVARGPALTWRVHPETPLAPQGPALQAQPPLFRMHCSFLI